MEFQVGDIFILNRFGKSANFYSHAQHFFTGKPYTHSALALGEIMDIPSVLSADELIDVLPIASYLREQGTSIWVYRPNVNTEQHRFFLIDLYNTYAGTSYGFAQILYFVYRWAIEKFGINGKKRNNPFKSGQICSELVYRFLIEIAKGDVELTKKLDEWNHDTIHVGDLVEVFEQFPEHFSLIYQSTK